MKTIALTAAALLLAAGTAFANNDNVGSSAFPANQSAGIDNTQTASIPHSGVVYKLLNSDGSSKQAPEGSTRNGDPRDIYGNR